MRLQQQSLNDSNLKSIFMYRDFTFPKKMVTCNPMRGFLGALCQLLFPPVCYNCRTLFKPSGRSSTAAFGLFHMWEGIADDMMAIFLCPQCRRLIRCVESPMCSCCGIPFSGSHGPDHICGDCEIQGHHFASARSAGLFQSTLRELVHQLKFFSATELALPLGKWLWERAFDFFELSQFDVIIPVPLHKQRLRKRGFNQTALLVNPWVEFNTGGNRRQTGHQWIRHDCLIRSRPTSSQTGLNKSQRLENLANAFQVPDPQLVKEKHLLLVDDVMTTGATVDACALALMKAGAARVDVMTLARAI